MLHDDRFRDEMSVFERFEEFRVAKGPKVTNNVYKVRCVGLVLIRFRLGLFYVSQADDCAGLGAWYEGEHYVREQRNRKP